MKISIKEKMNRRGLRVLGASDGKVYIGPQMAKLNITNRCTLRCRYCGAHAPGNPWHLRKRKDLPFDQFKELVRDLKRLKVDSVDISGDGEPTLHPRFADMMAILGRQPFDVAVVSNGTFPSAVCRDVLKADSVRINLSAPDRELYKELQGQDFFVRVTENIRKLAALRDARKPGFRIHIVFVVNRLNAGLEGRMRALIRHLGADGLIAKKMDVHPYDLDIRQGSGALSPELKKGSACRFPCFEGWFFVMNDLGGGVGWCCSVQQKTVLNIKKRSLYDIWFSKEFMRIRMAGRRGDFQKMFEPCGACIHVDEQRKVARTILAMNRKKMARQRGESL